MDPTSQIFNASNRTKLQRHPGRSKTLKRKLFPWLKTEPTPEQNEAIEVLTQNERHLLLDSTGLGKTYSAILSYVVLRHFHKGMRFLVVGSKSAAVSWRKQIKKHTTLSHKVYDARSVKADSLIKTPADIKEDISIITYTSLRKFKNLLRCLLKESSTCLVIDEVHRIKDPTSDQGIVVRYMLQYADYAWGLTATPTLNHLEDIYGVFDPFFPLELAPDIHTFMERYTIRRKRKVKNRRTHREHTFLEVVGFKDLRPLARDLAPMYLMRSRDLDIRFHYSRFKLPEEEEDRYLDAARGALGGGVKDFVARLPDLQLVANGTEVEVIKQGAKTKKRVIHDKDELSIKELQILEKLHTRLEEGECTVVFTHHRPTLKRLSWLFEKYLPNMKNLWIISGDTSDEDRDRAEEKFTKGDILLITSAGGESLNLQASNTVYLYDTPFSLGTLIQVIGRVARMDSSYDHMDIHFLIAEGTIDEYKQYMVKANANMIRQVVGGNANLPKSVSIVSKSYVIRMRKELLWKIRRRTA